MLVPTLAIHSVIELVKHLLVQTSDPWLVRLSGMPCMLRHEHMIQVSKVSNKLRAFQFKM